MYKENTEDSTLMIKPQKRTNCRKVENYIPIKIYKLYVKDSSVLFKDDILNFMFLDFFDKLY